MKDLGLLSGVKGQNPWAVHFDEEEAAAVAAAAAAAAVPGVMGAANGNPSIRSSTGAGIIPPAIQLSKRIN